jgi:hypothetical protein
MRSRGEQLERLVDLLAGRLDLLVVLKVPEVAGLLTFEVLDSLLGSEFRSKDEPQPIAGA